MMPVQSLFEMINETEGIEGITLLGGEPLQQSTPVLNLITRVRQLNFSIFLYTGYDIAEFDEEMQACFDSSDIVVTGRYVHAERDTTLRWRGSRNQIVHHPTGLYSELEIEDRNEVEFVVNEEGSLAMYGYPDSEIRAWVAEI